MIESVRRALGSRPLQRRARRWALLPLPRRTIRLRLTLLYGGLFVMLGAGLLVVTYILVIQSTGNVVTFSRGGVAGSVIATGPSAGPKQTFQLHVQNPIEGREASGTIGATPTPITPELAEAQARSLQSLAHQQHTAEMHQLLIKSGVALALMAFVALGLGWIVAGRVLRPLQTITSTVRAISASNLHQRLALVGPNDELTELGNTFDGLLARLESSFQAQRQFVANASHELRTPLARQRTLLEVALDDPGASVGSLQANNRRVLAAGEQQEHLIEALLTLARSERGLDRRELVDLAAIVSDALDSRHEEIERRGLRLDAEIRPALLGGDPRLVERLVCNLLDNATRHNVAAGTAGWIEVRCGSDARGVTLAVVNSGATVPAGAVERLLEPFARLGGDRIAARDGLGLGLSIVRAIAAAHDAELTIEPGPAGGLAARLRFPPLPSSASAGAPQFS